MRLRLRPLLQLLRRLEPEKRGNMIRSGTDESRVKTPLLWPSSRTDLRSPSIIEQALPPLPVACSTAATRSLTGALPTGSTVQSPSPEPAP